MTVRVFADSNVFYLLGAGTLKKSAIVGAGEELWATPIALLEISAGVRQANWLGRVQAARAIVSDADGIAPDPEQHLVAQLDPLGTYQPKYTKQWRDVAKALAGATSPGELESGVADHVARVLRAVNVELLEATKSSHYDNFASKMAAACDYWLPGYSAACAGKLPAPKIKDKAVRTRVRSDLRSAVFIASTLTTGLAARYGLVTHTPLDLADTEVAARAIVNFGPYCAIYGGYVSALLTTGAKPEPNDWGDLDLFLYLQPGALIATGEKKWLRIAKSVGLAARLREAGPSKRV